MTWKSITFCDEHGDDPCECERFPMDVLENDAGKTIATIYFSDGNERFYGTVLPVEPFVPGAGWKMPPLRTGPIASFLKCQEEVARLIESRADQQGGSDARRPWR